MSARYVSNKRTRQRLISSVVCEAGGGGRSTNGCGNTSVRRLAVIIGLHHPFKHDSVGARPEGSSKKRDAQQKKFRYLRDNSGGGSSGSLPVVLLFDCSLGKVRRFVLRVCTPLGLLHCAVCGRLLFEVNEPETS